MISSSRGMVQVLGATYRIVRKGSAYEVVRVLDDSVVGVFRHAPELEVISGEAPEQLLVIARAALRGARLLWSPPRKRRVWLDGVWVFWRSVWQDMASAWLEPLALAPRAIRTSAVGAFGASGSRSRR
jgi:hypothetical protein